VSDETECEHDWRTNPAISISTAFGLNHLDICAVCGKWREREIGPRIDPFGFTSVATWPKAPEEAP